MKKTGYLTHLTLFQPVDNDNQEKTKSPDHLEEPTLTKLESMN
jgi:hypothetical protein